MKLIDLLVHELPKHGGWPVGAAICERYQHEGNIDFYDEKGNWPEDCGKKYGFEFAKDLIQHRDKGAMPTTELVTREQYEAALAALQGSAWNGEGLPPVGTECEYNSESDGWVKCEILLYRKTVVVMDSVISGGSLTVSRIKTAEFRPIRSEAERRREEVADSLNKLLGDIEKYPTWRDALSGIYDLVAAGEVPHLKLEASDE